MLSPRLGPVLVEKRFTDISSGFGTFLPCVFHGVFVTSTYIFFADCFVLEVLYAFCGLLGRVWAEILYAVVADFMEDWRVSTNVWHSGGL